MAKYLLVLLCGIAVGCNEERQPVETIEGKWRVEAIHDGEKRHPVTEGEMTYRFEKGRLHYLEGDELLDEYEYEIDRSVSPNAITYFVDGWGRKRVSAIPGIFQLKGDRLTIVWNMGPSDERPKEFRGIKHKDDSYFMLLELTGVRPNL